MFLSSTTHTEPTIIIIVIPWCEDAIEIQMSMTKHSMAQIWAIGQTTDQRGDVNAEQARNECLN